MRIGRRDVSLTNLDKVFFPRVRLTKGDLIEYYLDLAPQVLNHVARRPMLMKRYPDGADGSFFYQKRVPAPHPSWLETVRVVFPRTGRSADFPVVTDSAGLAWIVNLGCIDLNVWPSRANDVERPDYLLIDLDPSEGNPWEDVRQIALVVREVMDELGLPSYPKTSGPPGSTSWIRFAWSLASRRFAASRSHSHGRSSGACAIMTSRRPRGRSRSGVASSTTTGRTLSI